MDSSKVQEYIFKEREITTRILSSDQQVPNDFSKLFPEYQLEKMKGPFSTSLEPYSNVWELVPFREKIIVHVITTHPNENDFVKWYGVSVKDLLELERRGRVLLMVVLPEDYSGSLPDYLDPIIHKNPPCSLRFQAISQGLDREQLEKCDRVARIFSSLTKVAVDGSSDTTGVRAYHTTKTLAVQLTTLGYNSDLQNIEVLLKEHDIDRARRILEFMRLYHIGPSYYSLGGLHNISWNAIGTKNTYPNGVINRIEFFDNKLASLLVKKLKLYRPGSMIESLQVFHDYTEARKALHEAQKWLRKEGIDNIQDAPLEQVEEKFDEILKSYEKRQQLYEIVFWGGTVLLGALPCGTIPAMAIAAGIGAPELIARLTSKPDPIKTNLLALATEPGLRTFFNVKQKTTFIRNG